MSDDRQQLRNEIMESQKIRSDLLKWKLLLVAVLGASGLGLVNKIEKNSFSFYILCCIPFVCLYVDLLCKHLNLRMIIICKYFRLKNKIHKQEYENFVDALRKFDGKKLKAKVKEEKQINVFALEDMALEWATLLLSFFLFLFGFSILTGWISISGLQWWPFFHSGLIGLALSALVSFLYKKRLTRIDDVYNSIYNQKNEVITEGSNS